MQFIWNGRKCKKCSNNCTTEWPFLFVTKGLKDASPFVSLSACKLKVQILTFKTMCQAHLWLLCRHVLAATQSAGLVCARTKTDASRTTAADKDEPRDPHMCVCISCAFRGETLIKLYMFFGLGRGKFHLPFHISCEPLGVCINLLKWFSLAK